MAGDRTFQNELEKSIGGLSQDQLIDRIKKCEDVVNKLEGDEVWQTVINDAKAWVQRLDLKWQEIYDEKQLANLRVLKLAYNHISQLPNAYKVDLTTAQMELDRRRNTDSEIQRDYDLETNIEMEAT